VPPLPDDALEVTLTDHAKQIAAALLEVIEIRQARLDRRHDGAQAALAFQERQAR
jgi:hypothetical protein